MLLENLLSGQNFVNQALAEGSYNYYGFVSSEGTWRILREKTDGTELLYAVGKIDYVTNFANRASLTYKRPDQLPKPR